MLKSKNYLCVLEFLPEQGDFKGVKLFLSYPLRRVGSGQDRNEPRESLASEDLGAYSQQTRSVQFRAGLQSLALHHSLRGYFFLLRGGEMC